MRRRSSSSNSSVEARDRASAVWDSGAGWRGAVRPRFRSVLLRRGWCRCFRVPNPACSPRWRRCPRWPCARPLDVGQRAHGERQAVGQVGAVAVAQRHAAAHDVVAEPFQVASVHALRMTHQGGNVESSYPFYSVRCLNRLHQAQYGCKPRRTHTPGQRRGRCVRCGSSDRRPPSPRTPPVATPISAGGWRFSV